MDDLLLIILMIVVSVIGALGQINKKKRANQQENVPEEKKDNFWDFLNEEAYGQEEQPEEETETEEPVFEPVKQPEAQPKTKKTEYRFSAENEGQGIYNTEITDLGKEDKGKTKKKLKDFSLRKAVIYNEILNRKYE